MQTAGVEELFVQIKDRLGKLESNKAVAVFDCDGTILPFDIGDSVIQAMEEHKGQKLFEHYRSLPDPEHLFFAAEVFIGFTPEEVQDWVAKHVLHPNFDVIQPVAELIRQLQLLDNLELYVVTASPKDVVIPCVTPLGFSKDNVLGIELALDANGKYSSKWQQPVTKGPGKLTAIQQHLEQKNLLFGAGNSMGDHDFLAAAQVSLAIHSSKQHDPIYQSEQELQTWAKANQQFTWQTQQTTKISVTRETQ